MEGLRAPAAAIGAWLNDEINPPGPDLAVGFAVLKAITAHLYIAWIHPFADGNGRTARLVEFQILLSGGVPDIAAHLLSNFYNQTRTEYYRQLDIASKPQGGPLRFLAYAVRGLRDALDEQIQQVRKYQWEVAWRDYVYRVFSGERGEAAERRRLLAWNWQRLRRTASSVAQLRRLTPEIAVFYASKTLKTVSRDVNDLQKRKLLRCAGRLVKANKAILTGLLPERKPAGASQQQMPALQNTEPND